MTTYNFTLSNSVRKNGERTIVIQFIKDRKNTSLSISKSCLPKDWSQDTSRVKKGNKNHKVLNTFITKYEKIITELIDDFELSDKPYELADLVRAVKTYKDKRAPISFTAFMEKRIKALEKEGKISSHRLERDTLSSLQRFFGRKKISFRDISYNNLYEYVSDMRSRGNKDSTIGIRLRMIRASFNKAINREIIPKDLYPFDKFKVSKYKNHNKKEFLTEQEVITLKGHKCQTHWEQFAKDMFLLSYYARGVNFVDLILLKKSYLSGKHINYIRRKTGVPVTFKVNDFIYSLIKKYAAPEDSPYLFDIVKQNSPTPTYIKNKTNKYLAHYINPNLKTIMEACKINKHITYYCARHTFATLLKFNGKSIELIREALGHRDIKSTMSYLNTLPEKKLDEEIDDVLV